jgi:hypothetical protein
MAAFVLPVICGCKSLEQKTCAHKSIRLTLQASIRSLRSAVRLAPRRGPTAAAPHLAPLATPAGDALPPSGDRRPRQRRQLCRNGANHRLRPASVDRGRRKDGRAWSGRRRRRRGRARQVLVRPGSRQRARFLGPDQQPPLHARPARNGPPIDGARPARSS